jgi:uncharacterized protein (DUF1684 family)
MSQLKQFRKEKDEFFSSHPQSPLNYDQQKGFKGLNYFPENPHLAFEVSVDEFPEKQEVEMQTSTGDVQMYRRYGRIKFTVDNQPAELTIYESDDEFFMPFVDSLAGKETYGAGRYLDPQPLGKDGFIIDFNYAYNPYCAYNIRWSCPIPPAENRLKVPIRAGEKIFEEH